MNGWVEPCWAAAGGNKTGARGESWASCRGSGKKNGVNALIARTLQHQGNAVRAAICRVVLDCEVGVPAAVACALAQCPALGPRPLVTSRRPRRNGVGLRCRWDPTCGKRGSRPGLASGRKIGNRLSKSSGSLKSAIALALVDSPSSTPASAPAAECSDSTCPRSPLLPGSPGSNPGSMGWHRED